MVIRHWLVSKLEFCWCYSNVYSRRDLIFLWWDPTSQTDLSSKVVVGYTASNSPFVCVLVGFLLRCQIFWHLWRKAEKIWVRKRTDWNQRRWGRGETNKQAVSKQPSLCWPWQFFCFSEKEEKSKNGNFIWKNRRRRGLDLTWLESVDRFIVLLKKVPLTFDSNLNSHRKQKPKKLQLKTFFHQLLRKKNQSDWGICDWKCLFFIFLSIEMICRF